MRIQKTFSGICPEYEKEATITAEYAEIRTLGNPMANYKYLGHNCSIGSFNGCTRKECPLIRNT